MGEKNIKENKESFLKSHLNNIRIQYPEEEGLKKPLDLSIVIPLLNEAENLRPLYKKMKDTINLLGLNAEIIFIDDGSTDNSWLILTEIASKDEEVKLLRHRRNFGKASAFASGFTFATGNIIVTMDADLQDEPAEIPKLIQKIEEGYDVVVGWKKERQDPVSKTFPSKVFNYMERKLSRVNLHDINSGLKAYRWNVIRNLIPHCYGEMHRFFPVLAAYKGYIITEVPVKHHPRVHGHSKYGYNRFYRGFMDLFTVVMISRYYGRPLHLFGLFGISLFSIGSAVLLYLSGAKILFNQSIGNRPLLMLGVLLLITGLQIILTGLIAELIRSTSDNKQTQDYVLSQVYRIDRRSSVNEGKTAKDILVERRNNQIIDIAQRDKLQRRT